MRKYNDEFKRNVLRKVFDGQSVPSISREIGVNESLIHMWKRSALDTFTSSIKITLGINFNF